MHIYYSNKNEDIRKFYSSLRNNLFVVNKTTEKVSDGLLKNESAF